MFKGKVETRRNLRCQSKSVDEGKRDVLLSPDADEGM